MGRYLINYQRTDYEVLKTKIIKVFKIKDSTSESHKKSLKNYENGFVLLRILLITF